MTVRHAEAKKGVIVSEKKKRAAIIPTPYLSKSYNDMNK